MDIEVWTPRGIEMVDADDFRDNWVKVSCGLVGETYDRIKAPPTTEYHFSGNWQPIPLSMVIIGAMSIGFVLGVAL